MVYEVPVNKAEIRTLIPHSGLMCLLDEITQWDDESITCVTNTHRDSANPLRRDGRLSVVHAFEYGAQAAAVHGGLRARSVGATAPPGYLAALRDARLYVVCLDDIGRRCKSVQTASSVTAPTQFMNAAFWPTMLC